jgi:hypothetical protein
MIIQCPNCCSELELPDDARGRKVQCACCEEKFIATEALARGRQTLRREEIVSEGLKLDAADWASQVVKGDKEYHRIADCLYGLRSRGADKLHKKYTVGHIWVQDNNKPNFINGLPAGIGLVIDEAEKFDEPPAPPDDLEDEISYMIGRVLRYVKTFSTGPGRYSHSYAVLEGDLGERQYANPGEDISVERYGAAATQYLGKGTGVDWSMENAAFARFADEYGISDFRVNGVNPYCMEVSIPLSVDEDDVRDFANDFFDELGFLSGGEINFHQFGPYCFLDKSDDCYYVVFNHHSVVGSKAGDANCKYTVEAVQEGGGEECFDDEITPEKVMQYIAAGIKSGAIRSKSGEGFFVLEGKYYDQISAGEKTTECRDISPRNLSKSIGIKTVKLQRGYKKVQMRYMVESVKLMDANGRECDPYNIPAGFIATRIAIHLGERIE